MKLFTNKGFIKKIIIAILLVMSFNFVSPTISQASFGGALFEPISQLIVGVSDSIIMLLQYLFTGDENISYGGIEEIDTNSYHIKYSPGIIFSGKVPGLDVNFINPNFTDSKGNDTYYVKNGEGEWNKGKDYNLDDEELKKIGFDKNKATLTTTTTGGNKMLGGALYKDGVEKGHMIYTWTDSKTKIQYCLISTYEASAADEDDNGVEKFFKDLGQATDDLLLHPWSYLTSRLPQTLGDAWQSIFGGEWTLYELNATETKTDKTIESSAKVLQDTVATWYKALRAIALVGLLSILVYIGIRILISSTGQEKAKYKKMIVDWLAAICILFILQYIMVFTLELAEKLTNVLEKSVVAEDGTDVIMTNLRNKIEVDGSDTAIFGDTVMYAVLVFYTALFTIQYLKRLLYMAFFTMIAPLISLTYPLDKIKDGQAQAFTIWVREYVFNALLQVMHLLLYYMFVSSAIDLAIYNQLYAIAAIGFMTKAEKFFRKMFGFDQATSAGQLGAAAGGALIMNAINKMGQRSGKQAAGKAGGSEGGSGGTSTPRYIPAPGAATSNGVTPDGGSPMPVGATSGEGVPVPVGATSGGGTPVPVGATSGGGTPVPVGATSAGGGSTVFGQTVNPALNPTSSRIGGVRNVAGNIVNKKNLKNGVKTLGRMARKVGVGAAGVATLGTVGLAAGVATGDLGNAIKYAGAGAFAGYMGANKIGDTATQLGSFAKNNYKEGKWGTDEFNTQKSIKELKNDHDFNKICENFGFEKQSNKDALIRKFHSNGITKSEDIKKAMNIGLKNGASEDEIIAAAKINQTLTKSYWGQPKNRQQFITDLKSKGVSDSDAKRAATMIDHLKGDLS